MGMLPVQFCATHIDILLFMLYEYQIEEQLMDEILNICLRLPVAQKMPSTGKYFGPLLCWELGATIFHFFVFPLLHCGWSLTKVANHQGWSYLAIIELSNSRSMGKFVQPF